MRLSGSAWLLFVLLCAAPQVAREDALEEAKRIVKQANTQYQLGRFVEANEAYERSYLLVPTPGLLFNLGQCQMALENYPRAIFFFEGYLRDKPDAPNLALVRDLIAEARRAIRAKEAKQREDEAAAVAARTHLEPAPLPVPPPPPPPRDRRRVPAVAIGAASIALLGASLYLGMQSNMADNAARLAAPASPTRNAFGADRRHYAIGAGLTGSLALVGAVTSGVLGYLGFRPARTTSIGVVPTGQGAAALVSGSF